MRVALFGGTFDPIHSGHLRAAKAAMRVFHLDRVLFVPSGNPPHKLQYRLTPFPHRFSMLVLACAREPRFIPSLLESPASDGRPQYSISTARRVKKQLGRADQLFFLIGADAFLDLPHWKSYSRLLELMDFIVVSRPGFSIHDIHRVIPGGFLRLKRQRRLESFRLRRTTLHVLHGIHVPIAARNIRENVRSGHRVAGLVPSLVEEYIRKEGLYRPVRTGTI